MMYANKMAFAVRVNGKVLRELNETVFVPFGSEYSLLIKNLNSLRAKVRITIDGTDVIGDELVVHGNSSVDIERFVKHGNWEAGNKFKFIERTKSISNHRGNKVDDGLIRIEFEFEKPQPVPSIWYTSISGPVYGSGGGMYSKGIDWQGASGNLYDGEMARTMYNSVQGSASSASEPTLSANYTATAASAEVKTAGNVLRSAPRGTAKKLTAAPLETDTGITVAGSVSNQKFVHAAWFPTDGVKHVMVMQMLGETEQGVVEQPLTVYTKPTCDSCGKVNKATSKFCTECGTSLQLV